MAEKGPKAFCLLRLLPDILEFPNRIYLAGTNRLLYVRSFPDLAQPYAVVLEVKTIVVTVFETNEKYLEGFKILWRTESSFY